MWEINTFWAVSAVTTRGHWLYVYVSKCLSEERNCALQWEWVKCKRWSLEGVISLYTCLMIVSSSDPPVTMPTCWTWYWEQVHMAGIHRETNLHIIYQQRGGAVPSTEIMVKKHATFYLNFACVLKTHKWTLLHINELGIQPQFCTRCIPHLNVTWLTH